MATKNAFIVLEWENNMNNKDNQTFDNMPNISQLSKLSETEYLNMTLPEDLPQDDIDMIAETGILFNQNNRSSTLVVRDQEPVCLENDTDNFEMLPIAIALERYDWLREKYYFNAVPSDYDEVVKECASHKNPVGYFIRVKKGAKVDMPCQAAMYIASEDITQTVHNIVLLEEDSELSLITGCLTHNSVSKGLHHAVEEIYIGKNAKLTSTMVHSWGSEVSVYPRTATIVEENGVFESNYVSLRPAKHIQSNPKTYLNGKGATTRNLSIILAAKGSVIDTAGVVYLNAEDTSAEHVQRGVCTGGKMIQGGLLVGKERCRAHVDCAGMLLDESGEGYIESIPGIKTYNSDARMSHEASIGKVAPEQVEYLMARGLEEAEAVALLIRGFLGADVAGLGEDLDAQIAEIVNLAGHND